MVRRERVQAELSLLQTVFSCLRTRPRIMFLTMCQIAPEIELDSLDNFGSDSSPC